MTTRIAVSVATDQGLDAPISPHFGRCPYFALVEIEGQDMGAVETVANPYYANHEPGQVPGFVHSLGANVMLSGGMGGRAVAFFRQYGVEPATGASGTVRDAIAQYLDGGLSGAAPCTESVEHGHH